MLQVRSKRRKEGEQRKNKMPERKKENIKVAQHFADSSQDRMHVIFITLSIF